MFPPLRLKAAWNFGGLSARELMIRTWQKINQNEIQTRAAGVAFYAMLALVPFIGLVLALAVQLLPDLTGGSEAASGVANLTVEELQNRLKQSFPDEASSVMVEQITRLQKEPPVGLLSIGLAITLWLASSLFVAVIDAMNRIYGIKERRNIIKLRIIAIIMTLIQALILVGSLVVIVGGPMILKWLGLSEIQANIATVVQYLVVELMVLMSFALAFYVAPDSDQRWEWITPGSILGSLAFIGVTLLFRLYVEHFADYDKAYGPLGGVMVLLFWFWISSLVLLTAGQINKIIEDASPLGKNFGQRSNPTEPPDFTKMEPVPANP
ncbi:YihY/virulence factor BrkB family protein [Tundrisphaera sp. TA3]|uniref:YihY/virulence factor BrkB family protein n=1 Tax=Tundrisphaera sp. TA3 TaxID=3435775 RepID=UPI003EB78274